MAAQTCKAIYFDGVDDIVSVADNAAFDCSAAVSFSFWLWRHLDDSSPVLIDRQSTVRVGINALDQLYVTVSGLNSVIFDNVAIPKQDYVHVGVVVVESGTSIHFKLYINGSRQQFVNYGTGAMPAAAATAYYIGGNYSSASLLKGCLTNLYAASDEITAAEFATLYADGWSVSNAANIDNDFLVLPFRDGSGTTVTNDSDDATVADGSAAGTPIWFVRPGIRLYENPLYLDAQGMVYKGPVYVKSIVWHAPSTDGHIAELRDTAGRTIFHQKSDVATSGNLSPMPPVEVEEWVEGLNLVDLDSGAVMVYWG